METLEMKKGNIPALRFPDFEGEWDELSLEDVVSKKISYGIVQAGEHVEDGMPYIKSQDLNSALNLDKLQRTSEEIAKKYRRSEVGPGDIIFSLRGNIGTTQIVPDSIKVANLTQGTARISVSNNFDNKFIRFNLQNGNTLNGINSVAKGSTFQEISLGELRNVLLTSPSLPEQQKISAFLTALDDKLQALKKKKSMLEQYKKGVMQKLFSQELRFEDEKGNDFPEWEEKKVGEIFRVTRGNVLSMTLVNSNKDKINQFPVYSSQTKNIGLSGYYHNFLFEDCITWTTDGANAGDVNFRSGKFYCTNVCGVLESKEGFANLCISEILNSVARKYVSFVGNPKLMNNVMAEISINIPTSIGEQTKIANFLASLDEKIAHCQRQIEKTELYKKGLLQQMFV